MWFILLIYGKEIKKLGKLGFLFLLCRALLLLFAFFFLTFATFLCFMAVLRDYQKDMCSRIDGAWGSCRRSNHVNILSIVSLFECKDFCHFLAVICCHTTIFHLKRRKICVISRISLVIRHYFSNFVAEFATICFI